MVIEINDNKILRFISNNPIFIFLIIIYFITRLFINNEIFFFSGDPSKYIELASNFPFHILYNKSFYLVHPVFFPYSISFFTPLFGPYFSGIIISIFSGLILLFVVNKTFSLLKVKKNIAILSTFFIIVSDLSVGLTRTVYKESLFLTLFFVTIYFFLIWSKKMENRYLLLCSFFGSITILTASQGIFLFPIFLIYSIFSNLNRKKEILRKIYPLIPIFIVYFLFVITPRMIIYSSHEYYPAGVEGTIEKVNNFKFNDVINPFFFPETYRLMGYTNDIDPVRIIRISLDVIRPDGLLSIIRYLHVPEFILYFFIGSIILIPILFLLKNYDKPNSVDLLMLLILVVVLSPSLMGPWPRHLIAAIVPLAYFLSKGFDYILTKINADKYTNYFIIFSSLVFIILFLSSNPFFLFSTSFEIEANKASTFISNLPEDGFMIQVGYVPEIIYQTKKRAIGLPFQYKNLDLYAEYYDINYIVFGQNYPMWDISTIDYVKNNPEKYELINIINENYDSKNMTDKIFIYKIL